MTATPQLTIAGNNDLAAEMSRHALASGTADPVYLWRDARDPLPAPTPVIVLSEMGERASFGRAAIEAGLTVVTLPIPDPEEDLERAVESGQLRQISRLHGVPALSRLHRDARDRQDGRRYGIYAAHRLPANNYQAVPEALREVVAFVATLGDGTLEHVRATTASFGHGTDGWFVLAQFANGTIATLEVSAVLPESDSPHGELLVEVTGSAGVLRAEPERQSVVGQGTNGVIRHPWYADPHGPLLERAMDLVEDDSREGQVAGMKLMRAVGAAAESDGLVRPD